MIFRCYENALAYFNAGVVAVNLKVVGLAPGVLVIRRGDDDSDA
jgi:hypothetical protein